MAATVSLDDAIKQYGVVGEIVNAIPELKDALAWAVQNEASQDALNAKIATTPWYQTHAEPLRNLILTSASDPATFQANLLNAKMLVAQTAAQMGRKVNADQLAYQYLANGWTQQSLQNWVGTLGTTTSEGGGGLAGDAGQYDTHLKQVASSYGVAYTQGFIDDYINRIQSGQDSLDGFTSLMQARAKATYPHFAQQIDAGLTVANIADPYLATMAKTLEVPQTTLTLSDPYIKRALMQVDPKSGGMTSQPLWQFERTLKDDPRYDNTTQAKDDAFQTLAHIGKDWGFTG